MQKFPNFKRFLQKIKLTTDSRAPYESPRWIISFISKSNDFDLNFVKKYEKSLHKSMEHTVYNMHKLLKLFHIFRVKLRARSREREKESERDHILMVH